MAKLKTSEFYSLCDVIHQGNYESAMKAIKALRDGGAEVTVNESSGEVVVSYSGVAKHLAMPRKEK